MCLPKLMTVQDFLENFRIGRTSFYREVAAGRLPIVKVGRSTRVARADAEAWLKHIRDQQDGSSSSRTKSGKVSCSESSGDRRARSKRS